MKKARVIVLSILCLCGVGYLGYLIFRAKNIEKIELSGSMQTLYIVGDDIDFEDAKLKVTFKNGDIRMVDITDENVDISLFSTSLETSSTMKLTYKGYTLEIDYNVVSDGLYYLRQHTIDNIDDTNDFSKSYINTSSKFLVHLKEDGICDYYYKDAYNQYFMHDGFYDRSYNYKIEGDVIKLDLNGDVYNLEAYVQSGDMYLKTTKSTVIDGWEVEKDTKFFKHDDEFLTGRNKMKNRIANNQRNVIDSTPVFRIGETIKSSEKSIYLKVVFFDDFMTTVYIHLADGNFYYDNSSKSELDTSKPTAATKAYGQWHELDIELNYVVI